MPENKISNYKTVSEISLEFACKLNINRVQKVVVQVWKSFMNYIDGISEDASFKTFRTKNKVFVTQ